MTTSQTATATGKLDTVRGPRTIRETAVAVFRQPAGLIGVAIILFVVLAAIFAPLVAPHSPLAIDPSHALLGPGSGHPLGTDELGRDLLSRLIFGSRPPLLIAALGVLIGGTTGIVLGVLAGYRAGAIDSIIMRVSDIVFAFPFVLLGIALVTVSGPSVFSVGSAIGIGSTPMFIRLARAETLEEINLDYIRAARGMGATGWSVTRRHIVPNIASTMVVQMAVATSEAVVAASALDFLGLGTQPPTPSWGDMLENGGKYLAQNPIYGIAPGVVITLFVIAVNLFAAALANALNPRLRTKILRARGRGLRLRNPLSRASSAPLQSGGSAAVQEDE